MPDAIAVRLIGPRARRARHRLARRRSSIAFAPATGATLIAATHSRYVVDLNRDPSGAALYPGADNTELCPTRTFANEPIYGRAKRRRSARSTRGVRRTSIRITRDSRAEIERVRERHGYAVLLDGHSIRREVPRFFAGRLPDLNLGTGDGASCDATAQALAAGIVLERARVSRTSSTAASRAATSRATTARRRRGVHALQLEMAQACYMDEANPYAWDAARAAALVAVLERLVIALAEWRPGAVPR